MNCQECREKLLRALEPSAPSAEMLGHLGQCDRCRQFQQRLLQIESNVPRIPVPASSGPEAFKNRLRQLPANEPLRATPLSIPASVSPVKRFLPWIVSAMAASILVIASGLLYLAHFGGPAETPVARQEAPAAKEARPATFVAQVLECDLRLAEGASHRQRTKTVAELAELLQDAIASKPAAKSLEALAGLHRETLLHGLVPTAQRLAPADREEALAPIIGDLVQFHERVILLAPDEPALNDVAQKIAQDVRDARHQLRNLLSLKASNATTTAVLRKAVAIVADWQRDLPLIQAMVAAACKLAVEDNPLKRAQQAHDLAEKVGGEIRQAAQDGDGPRAAEMGQYLQAILTQAVAPNMTKALEIEKAPSREDLDRFARAVSKSAKAIEADLKKQTTAPNASGMQSAIQAVTNGRMKVENSMKPKH
jgi:hypothetical protein